MFLIFAEHSKLDKLNILEFSLFVYGSGAFIMAINVLPISLREFVKICYFASVDTLLPVSLFLGFIYL